MTGTTLAIYTAVHVVLSLIGIAAGLVVLYGLLTRNRMNAWTKLFLWTTVLTSVTGYGFPVHRLLPAHIVGALSLLALGIAISARYRANLAGGARTRYVVSAMIALYFNVFVLVVQGFEKVPALKALAPTQKEPPFAIAQLTVLVAFVVLTFAAAKRFRTEQETTAATRVTSVRAA